MEGEEFNVVKEKDDAIYSLQLRSTACCIQVCSLCANAGHASSMVFL